MTNDEAIEAICRITGTDHLETALHRMHQLETVAIAAVAIRRANTNDEVANATVVLYRRWRLNGSQLARVVRHLVYTGSPRACLAADAPRAHFSSAL